MSPLDTTAEQAREAVDAADKRFQTLRAGLALSGFQVHVVAGGHGTALYLVARWGMSRTCSNVDEVEDFLRRVGGKK